jgi:potassium-dependent mechanosensitive channel
MAQLKSLVFLLLIILTLPIQSATAVGEDVPKALFDINEANTTFDKLSLKLSTVNLNPKTLNQAINKLTALAKKAKICVDGAEDEIGSINNQIKTILGEESGQSQVRVDSEYLETQKQNLTKRQAECRLFLIRATEALEAYREASISLQQEITFTRGENILTRIQQLPTDVKQMNIPPFDKISINNAVSCIVYSIPLALLAFILSWRLQVYLNRKRRKNSFVFLSNTLLLFFVLFFACNLMVIQQPFLDAEDNMLYQSSVIISLVYVSVLLMYKVFFLLKRPPALLQWYGFDVVFLKRLGVAVLTIFYIHKLGNELLLLLDASKNILQLFDDALLIISLITMAYFIVSLHHHHSEWFKRRISKSLLYKLVGAILVAFLLIDFIGFSILAVNSASIMFSLMLAIALGTVLYLGVGNSYLMLSYNPHYRLYMKRHFGYSSEPPYIELLFLKMILQFSVVFGMTYLFAYLIGEASYFIDQVLELFIYGFTVGGIQIKPMLWFLGIVVFCLLSLFSRHFATKISRAQQFDDDDEEKQSEEEKQVAIASIVLYVGYGLSLIVGLVLSGFSFTSLTIVAGALSVGIGLGLQSIVNNFFSGLILLIEKPIKAGDRIKIDNIEGFVKKVSVRSTQVVTPSQEDIIIPNSDLITHQVVNYMFSDKFWRVKCSVGVAYGSDVDKVSDVLMEVAMSHPEVVKRSPNKPMVLFRSFGDSALLFEVWCLIKDVNKKYIVSSELNFMIDKACREHNITIAFPQQDVHIKFDKNQLPWAKPQNPENNKE